MIKAETAYRTITEVADLLQVQASVLRFWETQFHQIKPVKRMGGRRYYRAEDVVLLAQIRDLLYKEKFTIKGVQKRLREGVEPTDGADASKVLADRQAQDQFLQELSDIKDYLKEYV